MYIYWYLNLLFDYGACLDRLTAAAAAGVGNKPGLVGRVKEFLPHQIKAAALHASIATLSINQGQTQLHAWENFPNGKIMQPRINIVNFNNWKFKHVEIRCASGVQVFLLC